MKQLIAAKHSDGDDAISEVDFLLGCAANPNDERDSYRIGDLAREFGISLRTLRFYEDRGLLSPERHGTTRLYTRRDRKRLRLVLLAKLLGFSLTEAKQMIELYHQPDGKRRQLEVALERFQEQEQVLLEQRKEIEEALAAMAASLDFVRRSLAETKGR